MIRLAVGMLVAFAFAAVIPAAWAQGATQVSRGELLYSTHCIACHTQQVHWRERKLATDWASLDGQVRRWARNGGLAWSDDDVGEVARYLNGLHYRFAAPTVTGFGRAETAHRVAGAN